MSSRFVKGAMVLSMSLFIVRLVGLIYIIPFGNMVGGTGLALYGYAYVPFTILITLSGLGIPGGIAKFVSKYNADKEYDVSRQIFRISMIVMVFLGLITFSIMYFGAPIFANAVLDGTDMHNTIADVTTAIRMVSFAALIIPSMSIMRGFFQGNNNMNPTAISQLVEQLVRIALIIGGSFVVIYILPNGTVSQAVNISVFAAFVAAISSFLVLYRSWRRSKPEFDALLAQTIPHPPRDMKKLFRELLSYALPFAVISLIASAFQLIDTMTVNTALLRNGLDPKLAEEMFGIYITGLAKIIMIPVSFAIAFGQPLIPEITEKVQLKNFAGVNKAITSAIMLTSFITIPTVIGLGLLSNPIFIMLLNQGPELNLIGGRMFGFGALIALFMGLNAILDAIMQGIGKQYVALKLLVVGIVVKIIGNLVLIRFFNINGAILSTIIAFSVCIVLKYLVIKKTTRIQTRVIVKRHIAIVVVAGLMALAVWSTSLILGFVLDYNNSRFTATLYVIICGIIGVAVYGGLSIYLDITTVLLGKKIDLGGIASRFKRRK